MNLKISRISLLALLSMIFLCATFSLSAKDLEKSDFFGYWTPDIEAMTKVFGDRVASGKLSEKELKNHKIALGNLKEKDWLVMSIKEEVIGIDPKKGREKSTHFVFSKIENGKALYQRKNGDKTIESNSFSLDNGKLVSRGDMAFNEDCEMIFKKVTDEELKVLKAKSTR